MSTSDRVIRLLPAAAGVRAPRGRAGPRGRRRRLRDDLVPPGRSRGARAARGSGARCRDDGDGEPPPPLEHRAVRRVHRLHVRLHRVGGRQGDRLGRRQPHVPLLLHVHVLRRASVDGADALPARRRLDPRCRRRSGVRLRPRPRAERRRLVRRRPPRGPDPLFECERRPVPDAHLAGALLRLPPRGAALRAGRRSLRRPASSCSSRCSRRAGRRSSRCP